MRLLVLCDTDEFGRSGVGDFALSLSQQLEQRGIETTLLAIDPDPASRYRQLTETMRRVRPDWVSLHFVPYAFAKRGLVGRHTLPWAKIQGKVGTHILFHEIWIGAHQGANWRHRFAGALQKRGIQELLRELRPQVVHCTNTLYSSMLEREGIPNLTLPLFGSIEVSASRHDPYPSLLPSLLPGKDRSGWVVAALFGAIHSNGTLLPVVKWLNDRSTQCGKRLLVVSLGTASTAQAQFQEIASRFPKDSSPFFHVVGKLDAKDLSCWIRGADCGLATTPFNIIEKSSSAVAFAEHGIPVIVTDAGSPVRGIHYYQQDFSPEFWLFGDSRLQAFDCLPPRRDPKSKKDQVVQQFIEDLHLQ